MLTWKPAPTGFTEIAYLGEIEVGRVSFTPGKRNSADWYCVLPGTATEPVRRKAYSLRLAKMYLTRAVMGWVHRAGLDEGEKAA